ncbi:MAG: hypothetical protein E7H47_10830 [Escherichia coli]|nr:hypothetical protein [Escherichia coli]
MAKTTKSFLALLRSGNLGVPLVILCILAMVILPLPPALLDILFTFNIVLAVMVLLVPPQLRPLLARYARLFAPGLHVLSYNEVPDELELKIMGALM